MEATSKRWHMTEKNPVAIRSLFNHIANRYDLANSLLSFHLHALWNQKVSQRIFQKSAPQMIVDLCSGTGDIAIRTLKFAERKKIALTQIRLVDFSEEMLKVAKHKALKLPLEMQEKMIFKQADVTNLSYESSFFDGAVCAYGVRNVNNIPLFLSEVHRTLKPKGTFVILELTRPKHVLMKKLHDLYIRTFIPLIGKWLTSNKDAYGYLQESIRSFTSPNQLARMAEEAGFTHVEIEPLSGGIATLLLLHK